MENNNMNPEFTPAEKEPHNPVENLTLDPFGNQQEVDQAKEEVMAEAPDFAASNFAAPAQEQEQTPAPQADEQPVWTAEEPTAPQYDPFGQQNQQAQQQPIFTQQPNYQVPPQMIMQPPVSQKSKIAAGLLGIFLGSFGVHNFYLGYTQRAVIQLLITLLSCFTLAIVSQIWSLVESIQILTGSINTDGNGMPLGD